MVADKLSDSRIRIGDVVQVVKPDLFVRCGYPMTFDSARAAVMSNDDTMRLVQDLQRDYPSTRDGIVHELAKSYMRSHHFGGSQRSVHTEENLDVVGGLYVVIDISRCVSGEYVSGSWCSDPYDSDPAVLSKTKFHKILHLSSIMTSSMYLANTIKIEDKSCVKLSPYKLFTNQKSLCTCGDLTCRAQIDSNFNFLAKSGNYFNAFKSSLCRPFYQGWYKLHCDKSGVFGACASISTSNVLSAAFIHLLDGGLKRQEKGHTCRPIVDLSVYQWDLSNAYQLKMARDMFIYKGIDHLTAAWSVPIQEKLVAECLYHEMMSCEKEEAMRQ